MVYKKINFIQIGLIIIFLGIIGLFVSTVMHRNLFKRHSEISAGRINNHEIIVRLVSFVNELGYTGRKVNICWGEKIITITEECCDYILNSHIKSMKGKHHVYVTVEKETNQDINTIIIYQCILDGNGNLKETIEDSSLTGSIVGVKHYFYAQLSFFCIILLGIGMLFVKSIV